MSDERPTFRRRAVRPLECLRSGWELVRGNYWLFFGISLVGSLIAGFVPMGILVGPMMCGIYYCLLRQRGGRPVTFDMLFRGFEYFLQSLIATLLMMIPVVVIVVPAYIALVAGMIAAMPQPGGQPDPEAGQMVLIGFGVFFVVVVLLSVVVTILFFFTYPLIVDKKLSGVQAIGTSFRAGLANVGGLLGLTLLTMLLTFLGLLACYVGAFFVMPIHFAANIIAYEQVFRQDDDPMPQYEPGPLGGEDYDDHIEERPTARHDPGPA